MNKSYLTENSELSQVNYKSYVYCPGKNFHLSSYDKQEMVLIGKNTLIMLLDDHLQIINRIVSNSDHLLSEHAELAVHNQLGIIVSTLSDDLLDCCHPLFNDN